MTLILSGTDSSVSAPAVQGGTGGTTTGLYYPATNQIALAANGAQALLANSAQGVQIANTLGVGATTPSTSGAGISFPATQSASSDANTLDDYEEGTWTPTVGGTATYTDRYGYYTKVGNLVTVVLKVQINTIGTGGVYTITSLPFAARSVAVFQGSVGYFQSILTSVYSLNCYIDPNSTNLSFVGQGSLSNSNGIPIQVFGNNAQIYVTATYMTN